MCASQDLPVTMVGVVDVVYASQGQRALCFMAGEEIGRICGWQYSIWRT